MAWINWTITADGRKIPVSPITGAVCNAHDTTHHVTYEQAKAAGKPAFVVTPGGGYFFVDIDHCKDEAGNWTQLAVDTCRKFPGCYIEVSQSGKGLHIVGRVPPGLEHLQHGCKRPDLGLEFYTRDRFCAITETGKSGSMDTVADAATYQAFASDYFPPKAAALPGAPAEWTTEPCRDWLGPEGDDELLAVALKSRSVKSIIGAGATFKQLYEADDDALAKHYPDVAGGQDRLFDWSQAYAALCAHLAYWTGRDCARMRELWAASELGQRDKFTARPDYVESTILSACSICKNVYRDRRLEKVSGLDDQPLTGDVRQGYQYLCPEDQIKYFKDCCYVQRLHKAFTPFGLLKPEQFKVTYGGWEFALDDIGKKVSRNAWDVFTESQAFKTPIVHDVCFRPDLGSANIIKSEGKSFINTYIPAKTETCDGDPAPFIDFLSRMLPEARDREILLAYMAAIVQYPGVKFQWAPIIQGTFGNGKSMITRVMEFCVGKEYSHKVNAQDIDNAFNSWLTGKLLIVIDEIKTPAGSKAEEMLKWIITDSRVPIMAKGQDQTTGDNRANLILCSNHHDAVAKRKDDRRYAPFFTAQQSREDMARTGVAGDYFPRLYAWLRTGNGYKILNGWLRSYPIPDELNPAGSCVWAPETSSTCDAVERSCTPEEQDVMDAIDEGRVGFQGGWVSSIALRRLMDDNRHRLSSMQRGMLLEGMGYIKHPRLYRGRAGTTTPVDNGRPTLYIHRSSELAGMTDANAIVAKYCLDQGSPI